MSIDIAEGERQDKYPEVTLAFSELDSQIKSAQQGVVSETMTLIPGVESKFVELLEKISSGKKYLDLGRTTPYGLDLSFKLKGQKIPFVENVSSRERLLYWGDIDNGLAVIQFDPFLHDQFHPEGKNFEGFDTIMKYSHTTRVGVNLPDPSTSRPFMQSWRPFNPVFRDFNDLVDEVQSKFEVDNSLKEEFDRTTEDTEEKITEVMGKSCHAIKNRISQLADSLKRIRAFPSILPKYIEGGNSDLRYEEYKDYYFLPNEMKIVIAPIRVGLDGNVLKAKPILSKGVDVEDPSLWFKMAPDIETWLIEPLRKMGWSRP